MSTNTDIESDSPALGARENFWGEQHTDPDRRTGHTETQGTDPAEWVAHQLLLRFVEPICGETGRTLSEPTMYLPKQQAIDAEGHTLEYRQHRNRRRYEPESGRINWGESTTTDVPEVGYDTYQRCVHTYLAERDCRLTDVESYLEYAERVWCDPSMNSKDALEQFVAKVREWEQE